MIKINIALASLIALAAVTKNPVSTDRNDPEVCPGMLLINEIVASGSQDLNEFGMASDWIELHNPDTIDLYLEPGNWFISDAGPKRPFRSALPPLTIAAGEHVLIWCDGLNVYGDEVHVEFSLAAKGEHLVIHYVDQDKEVLIDEVVFGEQVSGISEGRSPDGGEWIRLCHPTPGKKNMICDHNAMN